MVGGYRSGDKDYPLYLKPDKWVVWYWAWKCLGTELMLGLELRGNQARNVGITEVCWNELKTYDGGIDSMWQSKGHDIGIGTTWDEKHVGIKVMMLRLEACRNENPDVTKGRACGLKLWCFHRKGARIETRMVGLEGLKFMIHVGMKLWCCDKMTLGIETHDV